MGTVRGMSPSRSLLLCISNPGDDEALRGMLAREGYGVDSVRDGAEALQQVRQQRMRCDSLWRVRSLLTSRTAPLPGLWPVTSRSASGRSHCATRMTSGTSGCGMDSRTGTRHRRLTGGNHGS